MKKILCVDDEHQVVKCLKGLLEVRGYDVVGTGDPVSTERLIDENGVDLVLLDVEMPRRNGLQVFDGLKEKYSSLPLLFVTGKPDSFHWDSEEQEARWKENFIDGLTDVLYKPFLADDLYDKVEALIGPA